MSDDNGRDPNLHHTPWTGAPVVAASVEDLDGFRTFLGREVEFNLQPGTDVIATDQVKGAVWARNIPGQDIFTARMRYYEVQQSSLQALDKYIEISEILMLAIQRITVVYAEADGKDLTVDELRAIIDQASQDHKTEAEHETERENNRMSRGAQ